MMRSWRSAARMVALALAMGGRAAGAAPRQAAGSAEASKVVPVRALPISLPLAFEANQGQFDKRVRFHARSGGAGIFLTDTEALIALPGRPVGPPTAANRAARNRTPGALLRMALLGARKGARATGLQRLPGVVNYLLGRDPAHWHTRVPTYRRVRFAGVYPGTDLVYYDHGGRLEYDFVLRPGADPRRIRLAFTGADRLQSGPHGELIAITPAGRVRLQRPFAYQVRYGRRVQVACRYEHRQVAGRQQVAIRVARYDTTRPLVVDPELLYGSYLGGSSTDDAKAVAVDGSGMVYVAGATPSSDFPVTAGGIQTSIGWPNYDRAFVTKVDPTGSGLVYSTYLGGQGKASDVACTIAVDASGCAHVGGETASPDFPVTAGAAGTSLQGGSDGFVAKLDATGTGLVYSTYLGGSSMDWVNSVAVGPGGALYAAGGTLSQDLATTTSAFQRTLGGGEYGGEDGFVAKLGSATGDLVASTYLGGRNGDEARGIAIGASGAVFVTGLSYSLDFPTTPASYSPAFHHYQDITATKFDASLSSLIYSTYIGGNDDDRGEAIAVGSDGAAYITGFTTGSDFPVTSGAPFTTTSYQAAIACKLDAAGSSLVYATLLGPGGSPDSGRAIAVDAAGAACIAGVGTDDTDTSGGFIAKLDSTGTRLLCNIPLGNNGCNGVAADALNRVWVVGQTSTPIRTTSGAFQPAFSNTYDGFVTAWRLPSETEATVASVYGVPGGAVDLKARLTRLGTDEPIDSAAVTFSVDGVGAEGSAQTGPDGWATCSYTVPAGASLGAHSIEVSFTGSADLVACSGTGTLTIRTGTSLAPAAVDCEPGRSCTLSATLTRSGAGTPVSGKSVAFTVDGSAVSPSSTATTDANGVASVTYTLQPDVAPGSVLAVAASFAGDSALAPAAGSAQLTATRVSTALGISPASGLAGGAGELRAWLYKPYAGVTGVAGASVSFSIDGVALQNPTVTTSSSGYATWTGTLPADLAAGKHTIGATFAGDSSCLGCTGTGNLTVLPTSTLSVEATTASPGRYSTLTATLRRADTGAVLAGQPVTFKLAGVAVGSGAVNTNSSGVATTSGWVSTDAVPGSELVVTAAFAGNSEVGGTTGSGALTVGKIDTALSVSAGVQIPGVGTPLLAWLFKPHAGVSGVAGATVSFSVDGVAVENPSVTTNQYGNAEWNGIALSLFVPGSHTITATFAGDAKHLPSTDTLEVFTYIPAAIAVPAVSGKAGSTVTVSATLTRSDTGAALAGKMIYLWIGGTLVPSSPLKSGADGRITISYTIPANTTPGSSLVVLAKFYGDSTTSSADGSASITIDKLATDLAIQDATAIQGGTAELRARLRETGSGAWLSGVSVSFTIDGAAFGASASTTDADGWATCSGTLPESVATGHRTIEATFAGTSTHSGASSTGDLNVMGSTKLTVASASGEPGGTVALAATLTRTGSQAGLSGKAIAFTVGGLAAGAGSVTTGSDGKATLGYTIPSGSTPGSTLEIAATFAGDSGEAAASGIGSLDVTMATVAITLSAPTEAAAGSTIRLRATMKGTVSQSPLVGKALGFEFYGLSAGTATTDSDGVAEVVFEITPTTPAGDAPWQVTYAGDTTYQSRTVESSVTINTAITCTLAATSFSSGVGATIPLYTYLWRNTDRRLLSGKLITFTVDGAVVGSATTDSNGYAAVPYTVKPGTTGGVHGVLTTFDGDATYASAGAFSTLTVSRAWAVGVSLPPATGARGKSTTLYAYLWRKSDGAMLAGKKVRFLVDGVQVGTGTSDTHGYAACATTIGSSMATGAHALRAQFDGDAQYDVAQANSALTVAAKDDLAWYLSGPHGASGSTVTLYVYIWSATSKQMSAGKLITFKADGATVGSGTSDVSGYARYRYTIPAGTASGSHTLRADFAGDALVNASGKSGALVVE